MLSIIVPTYLMSKSVHDLWAEHRRQIEAVASVPYEIVVVDNGSTFPPPQITTGWSENRGVAPAWNEGVRRAAGSVFCFLTCTTRVEPGWDANLVAVATSGRRIAMPYSDGGKAHGIGVTGWCWAIERRLWDEVGPFDETFVPVQYEDTDFFHRAIARGIELVNVPGAHVSRPQRRATWTSAPWATEKRATYIHMANRFRYAWKHDVDPNDVPPFWKTPLRDVAE